MNKELTNKLLSIYRELDQSESMRHFMPIVWNDKKWCAATEGHQFILIPENNQNKIEEPMCKFVNIAAVMPELNCVDEISIEKLKKAYEDVKMIKREIKKECPGCDGEGKFEHDGFYYECKSCDEMGFITTGRLETIKDPDAIFKIGILTFNKKFIGNLIEVIDQTNCQRLEIRFQKEGNVTVFELGNQILIGIMPKMELEGDEYLVNIH